MKRMHMPNALAPPKENVPIQEPALCCAAFPNFQILQLLTLSED